MKNAPIRIGFDARLAGPSHAGIGRYSSELLERLLPQKFLGKREVQWVVFLSKNDDDAWFQQEALPQVKVVRVQIPHYGFLEQTIWPYLLYREQLDLLYVPHFNVPLLYLKKYSITLHDLLWHNHDDARATTLKPWLYAFKRWGYRLVSGLAVWRAQSVVVPTKVVAQDVAKILGRKKGVEILSEGIPDIYRSMQIETSDPQKPYYCVYTGSLYPHKNFEVVLQALRLDPTMQVKVASSRSVFMQATQKRAEELGVGERVTWLGFVADSELIHLYQGATALIQPSLAEGFGLTGLEALAVGCPIIVSDIPIFHEVYQDQAQYFDPRSAEQLVASWKDLVKNPPSKKQRKGAQQFSFRYSWDDVAQKLLKLFSQTV